MSKKEKNKPELVENDPLVEKVSDSKNESETLETKVENKAAEESKEESAALAPKKIEEKVLNGTPRFNKFNK